MNAVASPADRRRWPRIDLDLKVVLRFDRAKAALDTRILNASARGVYLAMDEPRELGTHVQIDLYLADERTQITVGGVVVWVVREAGEAALPPGIGVFLTQVDERWTNFCTRAMADEDR